MRLNSFLHNGWESLVFAKYTLVKALADKGVTPESGKRTMWQEPRGRLCVDTAGPPGAQELHSSRCVCEGVGGASLEWAGLIQPRTGLSGTTGWFSLEQRALPPRGLGAGYQRCPAFSASGLSTVSFEAQLEFDLL